LDAETAAGASGVECSIGGCASTLLVRDADAADSNRAGCCMSRNREKTDKAHKAFYVVVRRRRHGSVTFEERCLSRRNLPLKIHL